jgi:hypothetical protein
LRDRTLDWWMALVPLLVSTVLVYFSLYQILSYLFRRHILWFVAAIVIMAPFALVFTQVSSLLQVVWVLALTPLYGVVVLLLTAATWMVRYYCFAFAVLVLIQFLLQRKGSLGVEVGRYEPFWLKHLRPLSFRAERQNKFWRVCEKTLEVFSKEVKRYWALAAALVLVAVAASTMVTARVPRNPTYAEAMGFVSSDKTNSNAYVEGKYICSNFAHDLQAHALASGFNCGYVTLIFSDWSTHALNCFNTTDGGLIFLEPQTDAVVTLQAGDAYTGLAIVAGNNATISGFYVKW